MVQFQTNLLWKEVFSLTLFFTLIAYFPITLGIIGILSLLIYAYLFYKKRSGKNVFLIIGCTGLGMWLLIACALFLIGYLGLGPVPS